MMGLQGALILLLGLAPASDPTDLVARLGSPRYVDREAAATALKALGADALPALRAAREAPSPEVRGRAASLLDALESQFLVQPTLVRLDFEGRPLGGVIKAIGAQAGTTILLVPENDEALKARPITLKEPEKVPFWKAIDKLSEVAQVHAQPGYQVAGSRGPVLHLFSGQASSSPYRSYSGPFRMDLVSFHHYRDLSFNQGVDHPALGEQLYAQLQVYVEPRLNVAQSREIKLLEAVDDLGQTLLPAGNGTVSGTSTQVTHFGGYGGNTGTFTVTVPLKRPEHPGQTIKVLRGVVPVDVTARKPDPLVQPLAAAKGKTFHHDGFALTIHEVKDDPNDQRTTIELTIRPEDRKATDDRGLDTRRLEVVDAQERPIPWYPSTTSGNGEETRITMTLMPSDGVGAPTQIRHYSLSKATAEANFEFRDLPLP